MGSLTSVKIGVEKMALLGTASRRVRDNSRAAAFCSNQKLKTPSVSIK